MNQQIDFFDLFMIILNSEIIKNNHEYSMMMKKNSEIFTIILIHSFLYYFHDFISFWNSHFIFILVFEKSNMSARQMRRLMALDQLHAMEADESEETSESEEEVVETTHKVSAFAVFDVWVDWLLHTK